jgi:proteasome lid subunit RPN8/RPN11
VEDLSLVTVATFSLRHEAEIARARLVAAGIAALVQADDEGGLNPGFYAEYGVRVVVRSEEAADAEAVLTAGATGEGSGHVVLHHEHVAAMVAQARFVAPEEGCGLVAFDPGGMPRFVYCLTNIDRSPHRFTVDPAEHYGAIRHAEGFGWEIAGAFHSHPNSEAVPSRTDIAAAGGPTWVHFIVGLQSADRPEVRAFSVRDGYVEELSVLSG